MFNKFEKVFIRGWFASGKTEVETVETIETTLCLDVVHHVTVGF